MSSHWNFNSYLLVSYEPIMTGIKIQLSFVYLLAKQAPRFVLLVLQPKNKPYTQCCAYVYIPVPVVLFLFKVSGSGSFP